MRKILISIFIFFISISNSLSKIVYLDVQYIIDNSNLGKFYKKKIKSNENSALKELKNKEKIISTKENDIKNQKNILKKEEINKKVDELNILVKDFQIQRNKLKNDIISEKKKYSLEIIKALNPLLTKYVENNNITLVLDKKNILVGVKTFDITENLLEILNEKTKNDNLINEN